MMGTITVVISDELEKEIRKIISREGRQRKGALSQLVETALRTYLETLKTRQTTFKAIKDGKVVAQAENLEQLAAQLKKAAIDPRQVRIIATPQPKTRKRIGLRGTRT